MKIVSHFKKSLLLLAIGSAALVSQARAVNLVGTIDPITPSGDSQSVSHINVLLGLGANVSVTGIATVNANSVYTTFGYDATGSVSAVGFIKDDSAPFDLSVSGYQFVLAKYGNFGVIWELAANEVFSVPDTYITGVNPGNGSPKFNGISHLSLYNPGGRVPDGGTTLVSLGVALLGLGSMRRIFAARV